MLHINKFKNIQYDENYCKSLKCKIKLLCRYYFNRSTILIISSFITINKIAFIYDSDFIIPQEIMNNIFANILNSVHNNWYSYLQDDDYVIHCHTKTCHNLSWRFSGLHGDFSDSCWTCGIGQRMEKYPFKKSIFSNIYYPYNGRKCNKCNKIECVDSYDLITDECGVCNGYLMSLL